MQLIQKLFGPINESVWHRYNGWRKWFAASPGQMWRRRYNGEWEYKQDDEPYEDWANRQF